MNRWMENYKFEYYNKMVNPVDWNLLLEIEFREHPLITEDKIAGRGLWIYFPFLHGFCIIFEIRGRGGVIKILENLRVTLFKETP